MRILMTQRELIHPAGSEMVAIEVANELSMRGHAVSVFCPKTGDAAKLLLPSGVAVSETLTKLERRPEIIHGQHHLPTVAAIAHFEDVPAIYYCHGTKPWVERPPMHPSIQAYVMMCEWMVRRARTEFSLPQERVTFVTNFVSTKRFSEVRSPPPQIRRAAMFGDYTLPPAELENLELACAEFGIGLDKFGWAYSNRSSRPEMLLQGYDLVFAIGKCALEAMAVGCAVIPVAPGQAGHLITMQNFDECAFTNFGPRFFTSGTQVGTDWLRRQLEQYSMTDVAEVTARVRRDHSLIAAVDKLEAIYRRGVETWPGKRQPMAFAPYLEQLAPEVDQIYFERESLRAQVARLGAVQDELAASTRTIVELQNKIIGCQDANNALTHEIANLRERLAISKKGKISRLAARLRGRRLS